MYIILIAYPAERLCAFRLLIVRARAEDRDAGKLRPARLRHNRKGRQSRWVARGRRRARRASHTGPAGGGRLLQEPEGVSIFQVPYAAVNVVDKLWL